MIVLDANLLAYLVLPGTRTGEAEAVLARDAVWVVPPLWRSELRSVVYRCVERGDITLAQAVAALDRAETVIAGHEAAADSSTILEFAARSGCSTYDCEYVALADALGAPLVTTDREVLRAFADIAVLPERFLSN